MVDKRPDAWRRVVVEKPFGHDLASAKELQATLSAAFPTDSIFRIDHYLGKETVQNILAMRFANEMFEPLWNSNYVDHVQITMAEDIGIGGRAGYYDGIGAARDVIQNHLLQLLALVAMEEPISFDAAQPARREAQGAPEHLPAAPARPDDRPWPVRRGVVGRGEGAGLPAGGGHQAPVDHRDLRRHQGQHRQPPLGRGPVLPAHRQAARAPGHRGGDRLQARTAPAVRGERHRGADPQRAGDPGPARRGHHVAVRREGARHPDGDPRRQHGLRLRRLVRRGQPGGLRAADPRRAAGRPTAVPAPRGGRAVLADPRPDHRLLGAQGASPRPVRLRRLGAGVRERDARPRRPDWRRPHHEPLASPATYPRPFLARSPGSRSAPSGSSRSRLAGTPK